MCPFRLTQGETSHFSLELNTVQEMLQICSYVFLWYFRFIKNKKKSFDFFDQVPLPTPQKLIIFFKNWQKPKSWIRIWLGFHHFFRKKWGMFRYIFSTVYSVVTKSYHHTKLVHVANFIIFFFSWHFFDFENLRILANFLKNVPNPGTQSS